MKRIQRKRTKGWKMPPNTKCVGRPSIWGNIYNYKKKDNLIYLTIHGSITGMYLDDEEEANKRILRLYKEWVKNHITTGYLDLNELRSYDALACWCPLDKPCHVDVLIELLQENEE